MSCVFWEATCSLAFPQPQTDIYAFSPLSNERGTKIEEVGWNCKMQLNFFFFTLYIRDVRRLINSLSSNAGITNVSFADAIVYVLVAVVLDY